MNNYQTSEKFEELKMILRQSLPSRTMLNNVSVGAIEINGMIIILKNRYGKIPAMPFQHYRECHDITHHYKELQGKAVIFDIRLLNRRGREALMEFYY